MSVVNPETMGLLSGNQDIAGLFLQFASVCSIGNLFPMAHEHIWITSLLNSELHDPTNIAHVLQIARLFQGP